MQQTQVNEERLDAILLAWLWCQQGKPATPAAVTKGVKPLLPAGAGGDVVAQALGRLAQSDQVSRVEPTRKGSAASYSTAAAGERRAKAFLGRNDLPPGSRPFTALAGYDLPALSTGLPVPAANKKDQTAFGKLLPIAVCIRHFGFGVPLDRGPDAARVALVKLALARAGDVPPEKIHLKKLPAGPLPALVAGPLLGQPDTAASNLDKLFQSTAGKILEVSKPAQIKAAAVRRWLQGEAAGHADVPAADGDAHDAPAVHAPPAPDVDLPTFSDRVLAAAADVARAGGPGVSNLRDKVLVNAAWRRYQERFGTVPLDWFKRRLSEANPEFVDLVREDLIPQDRAQEFGDAEVRTGASSYHYIRVPQD